MAKGKPRWQKISAYELAKATLRKEAASPEAVAAGRAAIDQFIQGRRPEACVTPSGKIVVR